MRPYIAYIRSTLRLTLRDRLVLFFNYLLPLIFFISFGEGFGAASSGGALNQVFTMVLFIGVLGSGFFGGGMRATLERETGILRRFKVAPITPAPILVASMLVGWITFMPTVFFFLIIGRLRYHMAVPANLISLLVMLTLGSLAFRGVGLIIASVVNSMAESQILIQLLYLPMLLLSGATVPLEVMPDWLQSLAQFLPAPHLYLSVQGILMRGENAWQNWQAVVALSLTTLLSLFVSVKLFRWEKEEKLKASAKLWVAGVLLPFLLAGGWQAYSKDNLKKTQILSREMRRSQTWLIRDARIFIGDGRVIETGSVLIRDGRIARVYDGHGPDPKEVHAEAVEASGKTLLPGLIDAHVHLGSPGGVLKDWQHFDVNKSTLRELAAYLYSGVVAVRSAGDSLDASLQARARIASGEKLGAELFLCGPMFTAPGGHGTEYFDRLPDFIKKQVLAQTVRTPRSVEEARSQVDALKKAGVDGIKAILEAGGGTWTFPRLDTGIFMAIGAEAKADGLPLAVHTGDDRDILDALAAGAASIEHGNQRALIAPAVLTKLKQSGAMLDPTLAVVEAFQDAAQGKSALLDRSLVQQVGPRQLIEDTKAVFASSAFAETRDRFRGVPLSLDTAAANLKSAYTAGILLVAGTDSGNFLLLHGPAIHRELQLWVAAGISPSDALQAATHHAAELLRVGNRLGLIQSGYDASLLLVEGNPLADIATTERIVSVFMKGERVARASLFEDDEGKNP
jgi:imidazolonepropionase-like amidohydrolase/ABC-type multidrug transport system permease subunit